MSNSSALNDKPFGVVTGDTSMGDKGIAITASREFTGDTGQDKEFEGKSKPSVSVSASQAQFSGRQ